ncbi:flavodoxin family protein [Spirochaetia bacterium]|nr:flavodoxin family protein [Spirochaetia bacterium]
MKYLVISGNPKLTGLCYSIREKILQGAKDGGAETELLRMERHERCRVCGDGWGTCREQHHCAFASDGFGEAQDIVRQADMYCFITPVYWGEMAEGLKCFFDRLRRCEFGPKGILAGKQVLLAASAGGTGNGLLTCLEQMDRFCRHTGAVIYDVIAVNRWNRDYKAQAAYSAAKAMAEGRKAGESLVTG